MHRSLATLCIFLQKKQRGQPELLLARRKIQDFEHAPPLFRFHCVRTDIRTQDKNLFPSFLPRRRPRRRRRMCIFLRGFSGRRTARDIRWNACPCHASFMESLVANMIIFSKTFLWFGECCFCSSGENKLFQQLGKKLYWCIQFYETLRQGIFRGKRHGPGMRRQRQQEKYPPDLLFASRAEKGKKTRGLAYISFPPFISRVSETLPQKRLRKA